jgi:hypothetical protein
MPAAVNTAHAALAQALGEQGMQCIELAGQNSFVAADIRQQLRHTGIDNIRAGHAGAGTTSKARNPTAAVDLSIEVLLPTDRAPDAGRLWRAEISTRRTIPGSRLTQFALQNAP